VTIDQKFFDEDIMPVFTPPGDESLQRIAIEVPVDQIGSAQVQSTIDKMLRIAKGERGNDPDKRVMVGLAAPQIGINKRIILVDMDIDEKKEPGNLKAFINPKITWTSQETVGGFEGCFSVDSHVVGVVPRSVRIKIEAYDRNGQIINAEFSDYTARIFQHEVDHLDGIRFPDRVGPDGRIDWVEESRSPEYYNNWTEWDCHCSWQLWLDMKAGKPYSPPTKTGSDTRS
jgi:peptide deformylase